MSMPCGCRGSKKVLGLMELELQEIMSHFVGTGEQNLDPLQEKQAVLTTESLLQLQLHNFKKFIYYYYCY